MALREGVEGAMAGRRRRDHVAGRLERRVLGRTPEEVWLDDPELCPRCGESAAAAPAPAGQAGERVAPPVETAAGSIDG